MFRKLRKWYFKIYHLFKLLGIFILIFGIQKNVYAVGLEEYQQNFKIAEKSCTNNLINPILINQARFTNGKNMYGQENIAKASYLIPIEEGKKYYLKYDFQIGGGSVWFFTDSNGSAGNGKNITTNGHYIATAPTGSKYLGFMFTNYAWRDLTNSTIALYEGEEELEYVEYSTSCGSQEPEQNEVYTNFLGIYINKLEYLANGFINNQYLFAMVGIIFAWIVLELFLKILHLKGGKYK